MRRFSLALLSVIALAGVVADAGAAPPTDPSRGERCAVRLSIALFGLSPSVGLLADPDPQSHVDEMVASPVFEERFARFLNAKFDTGPGRAPEDDAVYYVAKSVLSHGQKYEDVFLGPTRVEIDGNGAPVVLGDPDGLGYFRSPAWLRRYAGNEQEGYKIVTAYRMLNNTVGLELVAMTNVPGADLSAKGRMMQPCKGCHNTGWYALDHAAKILTRRKGTGATMTFEPPSDGPQDIVDTTVSDDRSFVEALVHSQAFRFNACRLAFEYVLGRPENACEASVFDACMAAFESTGMIQSAVAAVAKDPGFCQ